MKLIKQYGGMRREIYVLFLGRVVTAMGSMVWPILTLILNQKLGMNATGVALVTLASSLIMLPMAMLGGRVADRYNKKYCIIVCDVMSIVLYLIAAMIPLSYITIILITFASAGQRMERPIYNALIADLTKTSDREKAYSLHYLGINLGQVASPTIAGLLFQNYLWLVFLVCGLAIATSTVLIALKLKDITPVEEAADETNAYQTGDSHLTLWQVLRMNMPVLLFIMSFGFYTAAYHQYSYLMPIDIGVYHGAAGAAIYGTVTSLNCIICVLATPVVTQLLKNVTHTVKNVLSQMLLLIAYIIFILMPDKISIYYLVITLFTLGEVLSSISMGPYLTSRVPATHRGRVNGVSTVVQSVMPAIVLPIIGVVYDNFGSTRAWEAVMLILLIGIAAGTALINVDKRHYEKLYAGKTYEGK